MKRSVAFEAGALTLVTLLAAAVRVPLLSSGIWRDEASSYFDVAGRSVTGALREIALAEMNPPGYFLALKAWLALAGTSPLALKVPSFLCGVALVPATYLLARGFGSRAAALAAAIVVAVDLTAIELSAVARPYALAALLAALAAGAAIATARRASPRAAVAYALLASALLWVQYTGWPIVATFAAIAAAQGFARERRRGALLVLAASGAALLAGAPLWPALARAAQSPVPWASAPPGGSALGRALEQFSFALPFDVAHQALALECLVPLIVVAALARGRALRSDYPYLVLPVVVAALFEAHALLEEPRYMLALVPLAAAALGVGGLALAETLRAAWHARRATSLACACAIVAFAPLVTIVVALPAQAARVRAAFAQPQLSGMADLVRTEAPVLTARTLVIAAPDYLAPTYAYDAHVDAGAGSLLGFPHRDAPQFFRWYRYGDAWTASGNVAAALDAIERRFVAPYDRLALLTDPLSGDRGNVRLSLVTQLAQGLERRYRVVERRTFPGRLESVSFALFARAPRRS